MSPDMIVQVGAMICGGAALFSLLAAVALRLFKKRLDRKLDREYGRKRH